MQINDIYNFFCFTYTEAKVQQEEHVESHVDLQSEVFVEVLTGLDRTIRQREKQSMLISYKHWQSSEERFGKIKILQQYFTKEKKSIKRCILLFLNMHF